MDANAAIPYALNYLIRCVKKSTFSFEDIPQEQWRNVESLVQQHKLRSYIASISNDKVTYAQMVRLIEEQDRRRGLSEETCARLAHAMTSFGLSAAVIKGLSFEKCIYGDKKVRDVGDIDILILPQDTAALHNALTNMGYRQRIGPTSVGAKGDRALAAICASQGAFEQSPSEKPVRRHPYKAEYSPYVKFGYPTVEVHDGFYSIPKSYMSSLAVQAINVASGFLLDPLANFILLVANTYENSESFYSNTFDYGIVLRDYVDLHHFFLAYENTLDWNQLVSLVESLDMSDVLAVILGNYRLIYEEMARDCALKHVDSLPSKWGQNILERMSNENLAKQAAYGLFKKHLRSVSAKRPLALSAQLVATIESKPPRHIAASAHLRISRNRNAIGLLWTVPCDALNNDRLFQVGLYPLEYEAGFLLLKIDLGLYDGEIRAYAHTTQRYLCASAVKKKTRYSPPIVVKRTINAIRVLIQVNRSNMKDFWVAEGQLAITAEIYERHYGDIFWVTSPESMTLFKDVTIGKVGLLCERSRTFSLISGEHCFTVSTDDNALATRIKSMFDLSIDGWALPISRKAMRDYWISESTPGSFHFVVDGIEKNGDLQCAEVAQALMQDMTDCLCTQIDKRTFIAHAAAVDFNGRIVLLIGSSGSGKTSLAVGCTKMGALVGDECVFVNAETGQAWCEDFPFQIKGGNDDILTALDQSCALEVNGGAHGKAYYFPRSSVRADAYPETPKAVRCIVFPEYNADQGRTTIGKISPTDLVQKVLKSFMGECSPSNAFRQFARMVSTHGIEIITIGYSDAADAAQALHRYLMEVKIQ